MNEQQINKMYEFKKKAYKEHKLKVLFFEVTSRCNARCEHCGSSCGDFVPKDEITADEIKKVLNDVASHYDARQIMLSITGGEPLVRKDLFEIMKYARSLGFHWGITTNGILVNKKMLEKMVYADMQSVSVSIDGMKELHESFRKVPGSFNKIIKGIKLMLECPSILEVQVTTCVNKKNLAQLDDIYNLLKDLGIKNWRLIEVDPIGRAKDNNEILMDGNDVKRMFNFIREKRKVCGDMKIQYGCGHFLGNDLSIEMLGNCFLCYTGYWVGSVLSNGDVYGCPDIERRPELIQGNIRNESFVDIWEKKFKNYRKITRTSNSKCRKCPDWKLCCGDAFHTWNWDDNKPNYCIREVFKDDYK